MDKIDELDAALVTSAFEITVASSTVQLTNLKGDAAYNTRNLTSRPVHAKTQLVVTPPAAASWFTIDQPERDFSPGVVQQIPVHIQVPGDVPPGNYGFRLDVRGTANPDEEYAQGPGVTFTVPAVPKPVEVPPWYKRIPWWVFAAAAAGVLVIAGVVAFLLLRNVTVPNVVGQTFADAQATLQAASLKLGDTSEQVTGAPEGTVIQQNPAAATQAPRNSAVALVLEAARVVVPKVVGTPRDTGAKALTDAGLKVGTVTDQPTGQAPGIVLQQNPAAGAAVLRGSAVNLVVEAPRVSVPNVIGGQEGAAAAAITQAGLRIGNVQRVPVAIRTGTVFQQNPAGGAQVLRGSAVDLVVAQCVFPGLVC